MKNDKDKSGALKLLIQKQSDPHITYQEITEKTGYSKRQLIRLAGGAE
jgi:dsRNA-specific ribonuclease